MADQYNDKTYVRETRTTEPSGAGMALLVGGLVVAVGFILWLVFGGPGPVATTPDGADTTNVTIEPPAASTDTTVDPITPAPDAAAPAGDAITPAPADDGAVAPADDGAAAPADDGAAAPAPAEE